MSIKSHRYGMVRVVLLVVLVMGNFGVRSAQAATLNFGWAQTLGALDMDYGSAIALDENGNVYSTGFLTNIPGNSDIFIAKHNGNGDSLWANVSGGPSSDAGHAIAVANDGSVYVTGSYSSTVEFDPGNNVGNRTSQGLADVFLIKYDTDGNFLWVRSMGGTSSDSGNGIAVDGSGNVYIVGSYSATVDFDPGTGVSNLTSTGATDIFISKFDGDGDFLWAKSMGGPSQDSSFDITTDGNADVFVTGYFIGTADFDPGPGVSDLTSAGGHDLFVSKLDSSGNLVWAQNTGGALNRIGIELVLDGDGNLYVTGSIELVDLTRDIVLVKYASDGQLLWEKTIGGTGSDVGYGVAVDGSDNVYITGDFNDTVDFDPGMSIHNLTSVGAGDIFVSKLDRNGTLIWAESLGGPSGDLPDGLAVDGSGNVYLTGSFFDTVDFDPGSGTNLLTSAGMGDAFIARINFTPQIHYVKWNATGSNDGTSWTDAYTDLPSALAAVSSGDELWVAAGTYKPTSGTDRTVSFTLKNGVAVYGGFAGTETAREQRDVEANLTVLSGDIGVSGDPSDNSYHVLVGSGTNHSAILDGFTITAGNANATSLSPHELGGGMYIDKGSPRLNELIFTDNHARFGGGIYAVHTEGNNHTVDLILTNVVFRNNTASGEGGGMATLFVPDLSSASFRLSLTGVTFENNTAVRTGGGLINNGGELTLENVTFSGNTASGGGGLSNIPFEPSTLTNVTFSNNSATDGGGGMLIGSSGVTLTTLTNVTFNGNSTAMNGGGVANGYSSDLLLTNVTFSNNTAGLHGGGISNGVLDLASEGTISLINTTFSNNTANANGSAVYNGSGTTNIHNSILYGNPGEEIFGAEDVTYSIVEGGYAGEGNLDADPLLGPLQDNGGFTQTMALGAGSPAIDAASDLDCPATDQRGVTRPQGSYCDIGAYEAAPDTTPPSITSILRAGANPTNASSVNFTVTFSEPVTTVSASDFALHMTGNVSGATITGVTGSNDTYTVSVNTGMKNGTLRLDVPASATITDLAGNALVGLPFTTGEAYTLTRNSGADTTGVFRPSNGALYLKNSNTTGFADVQINYGIGGDYPVVGDWDGDGDVTIGIYRHGMFYLRQSNTIGFADVVFPFGAPGDQPVAGDWDGDGVDTIGVYRNGTFLLRNSNSGGVPDMIFALGIPGDVGIAGDWNGDGMDTTGVFRPSNGALYLKNQNTTGFADVQINYGIGGDKPVTGDWDGDGDDTIGIYRNGQFYLRNENTIGFADIVFALGIPGDHPIAGDWDGLP